MRSAPMRAPLFLGLLACSVVVLTSCKSENITATTTTIGQQCNGSPGSANTGCGAGAVCSAGATCRQPCTTDAECTGGTLCLSGSGGNPAGCSLTSETCPSGTCTT